MVKSYNLLWALVVLTQIQEQVLCACGLERRLVSFKPGMGQD